MGLTCYNDKWRYHLIIRIDVLNYSNPFPITRLYSFNFFTPVVRRYNKSGCDLTYEKACLVEVLDVGLYNIIFGDYILEKSKPSFNNLWICYISDLEEGEKTLLLHEGEGKLSRVRFKLIYRDFPKVRPCTGRNSILTRKWIGLIL